MAEPTSAASREITLMDLWLIVHAQRRLVGMITAAITIIGIALAFILPPQYQFRTAIEIGNQVVNEQIQPIEAPTTVISKLQNGYIPAITTQYAQAHADGPREYAFEVIGQKESQIVTIVSQGARSIGDKHLEIHKQISTALVQDHNRTADAMRDNAGILLSEAQQKLGQLVADAKSLADQVKTFDQAIGDMDRQSSDINRRISQLDAQLVSMRGSAGGDSQRAIQAMQVAQEASQFKSVQIELDQKTNEMRIGRAKAQAKLENNAAEQATARNTIQFRQTNLKNIQATRSLGTVTSIQPVAPRKPVVIAVAVLLGLIAGVLAALGFDFFARAGKLTATAAR